MAVGATAPKSPPPCDVLLRLLHDPSRREAERCEAMSKASEEGLILHVLIADAKKILMFSSDKDLENYISEEHPEWEIKDGFVFFQKAKESAPCKEIPSLQLINQTLSYARELERIV